MNIDITEMKTYKNIFFDLDGTVSDPYMGITNSILFSLKYYPNITPPSREELKVFIGPPLADKYSEVFGLDAEESKRAVEHYREYYRPTGIFENRIYDGIPELLRSLRENGKRVYLATSKPQVFAKQIIEHFGLSDCFDGIYGSTLDGSIVKKADVIAQLLKNEDCDVTESVMVGDTEFDIIGAAKLGIDGIGVTYGYGTEENIRAAAPCALAHSVSELSEMLLK